MKRSIPLLLALVGVLSLALGVACTSHESGETPEQWTCPMHPTYIADRAGTCPICNMDLVRKAQPASAGASSAVEPGGGASLDSEPEALRRAGVVTEVATVGRLARSVRAAGSVVADERRQVRAQAKISGWVERLDVNSTGLYVHKGAPAMAVYSPALLAAQSDYLLARDAANRFAGSQLAEVRRGGQELLVAARRRLELLDVPESFIVELDRTRTTQRTVDLLVPASGFVSAKSVVQGQEITPGMELYTVTDLASVWVEAAFFEAEARWIAIGRPATIHLPYDEGRKLAARVSYVYPTVDAAARTLTARFELPNPGFALRPGMFVDVELEVDLGEGVLIPASAVIDSGLRKTVFVEDASGKLEPREVETGERSGDAIQIVRGVAAGERVATRANFLLDAESRITGAAPRALAPAAPPAPDEVHR
ncbi:MAG: efflux RND transporter periplasmic adaptor subunit [Thermoanaerobaculia bacterium]|mgnify:CR=1 FL=1|nr:efflux RND transporter periplasmic adaptor subunit [Thermoanaerobaculia bacterium]